MSKWTPDTNETAGEEAVTSGYRGIESPHAKRKRELGERLAGHRVQLMPCKPFTKAKNSRRVRRHTWVRI
jgi:hypothetical protein